MKTIKDRFEAAVAWRASQHPSLRMNYEKFLLSLTEPTREAVVVWDLHSIVSKRGFMPWLTGGYWIGLSTLENLRKKIGSEEASQVFRSAHGVAYDDYPTEADKHLYVKVSAAWLRQVEAYLNTQSDAP